MKYPRPAIVVIAAIIVVSSLTSFISENLSMIFAIIGFLVSIGCILYLVRCYTNFIGEMLPVMQRIIPKMRMWHLAILAAIPVGFSTIATTLITLYLGVMALVIGIGMIGALFDGHLFSWNPPSIIIVNSADTNDVKVSTGTILTEYGHTSGCILSDVREDLREAMRKIQGVYDVDFTSDQLFVMKRSPLFPRDQIEKDVAGLLTWNLSQPMPLRMSTLLYAGPTPIHLSPLRTLVGRDDEDLVIHVNREICDPYIHGRSSGYFYPGCRELLTNAALESSIRQHWRGHMHFDRYMLVFRGYYRTWRNELTSKEWDSSAYEKLVADYFANKSN